MPRVVVLEMDEFDYQVFNAVAKQRQVPLERYLLFVIRRYRQKELKDVIIY